MQIPVDLDNRIQNAVNAFWETIISYEYPTNDLTFRRLVYSFLGHVNVFVTDR